MLVLVLCSGSDKCLWYYMYVYGFFMGTVVKLVVLVMYVHRLEVGSFDSLRIAHCAVGLYSNKTVNFAYKRPPPIIAQSTV